MITRRVVLTGSAAALTGMMVSGCTPANPRVHLDSSRKLYTTATSLAADSNAIVLGTLGSLVKRTVDGSGEIQIPTVIYEFSVMAKSSRTRVDRQLLLALTDWTRVDASDEDAPRFNESASYVLFLERIVSSARDGLKEFDILNVVVGVIAGIFDVVGEEAIARDHQVARLRDNAPALPRAAGQAQTTTTQLLALDPQRA